MAKFIKITRIDTSEPTTLLLNEECIGSIEEWNDGSYITIIRPNMSSSMRVKETPSQLWYMIEGKEL